MTWFDLKKAIERKDYEQVEAILTFWPKYNIDKAHRYCLAQGYAPNNLNIRYKELFDQWGNILYGKSFRDYPPQWISSLLIFCEDMFFCNDTFGSFFKKQRRLEVAYIMTIAPLLLIMEALKFYHRKKYTIAAKFLFLIGAILRNIRPKNNLVDKLTIRFFGHLTETKYIHYSITMRITVLPISGQ